MTLSSQRRLTRASSSGDAGEVVGVFIVYVLDVAEPVVDEAELLALERGADAAAAVVADDDDVLYLEDVDGVLHDGEAIEVAVNDDVGDVAMDEDFAGEQAADFIGRDAAVGAADPEISGRLLAREGGKEFGIAAANVLGPGEVSLEEEVEVVHGNQGAGGL